MRARGGGLVWSSDHGRMCPACRRPLPGCTCRAASAAARPAASDGIVRVSRETGGRGGKTVTVIRGVPLAPDALATLARRLKAACGSGGTVRDGTIELQGDHRDAAVALLTADGYRVKLAGG